MFIETHEGELVNLDHIRSIGVFDGNTEDGELAYAIIAAYTADALPSNADEDQASVELAQYGDRQDCLYAYGKLKDAVAEGERLFEMPSVNNGRL